jgi:hypothetical protein
MSGGQGTLGLGASLSHTSGLNGSLSTVSGIQSGGTLSSSVGLGYDYSFTDALSGSIDYSNTAYSSDSLNAVALLSNSLSLGFDYELDLVAFTFNVEHFFGSSPATYASFGMSSYLGFDKLTAIPSIEVSFISQIVNISKISNLRGKKPGQTLSSALNVSGISGISLDAMLIYTIGSGFSISTTPMLTYSPQTDLSIRSLTFSISAGIRYSTDF